MLEPAEVQAETQEAPFNELGPISASQQGRQSGGSVLNPGLCMSVRCLECQSSFQGSL